MRYPALAVVLLLCDGCPSERQAGDTPGESSALECDPEADRVGTYLVSYRERSGDCGPLPEDLVRWGTDAVDDAGTSTTDTGGDVIVCSLTEGSSLEDNGCTLTNTGTCESETTGQISHAVIVLTQEDSDGERFSGIYDFTASAKGGAVLCSSTYDVEYERQ